MHTEVTKELILSLSRKGLIHLLQSNDRNGIYSDTESIAEFGRVMTKKEGIEIALEQFELI